MADARRAARSVVRSRPREWSQGRTTPTQEMATCSVRSSPREALCSKLPGQCALQLTQPVGRPRCRLLSDAVDLTTADLSKCETPDTLARLAKCIMG